MASADFGGIMKFRDSSGRTHSLRGTFNINPGRNSSEAVVNQDGSADQIMTPQAPGAEIAFADKGVDFAGLIGSGRADVTIIEEQTGVIHLFTQAFYTGQVAINRVNGEVSGIGLTAASYRKA